MFFYSPTSKESSATSKRSKTIILFLAICGLTLAFDWSVACAQTAMGELEGCAAPVGRRQCVGGTNAGSPCNEDGDCPGSLETIYT